MLLILLYLISVLFLQLSFLRLKKNEKKQNIVLWFILSIILYMCFKNALVFGLALFKIKSYLLLHIAINCICIFLLEKISKKEKQNYYFDYKDIIFLGSIIFICILIFNNRFTTNFNISFETTDPAIHYRNAILFKENNTIGSLIGIYTNNESSSMYFAASSLAGVFQIFGDYFHISYVHCFILFEMCVLLLSAFLLYLTIRKDQVRITWMQLIFSFLITLLYICGYPLNNLLFGFHYLGLCILLINALFVLFDELLFTNKNRKIWKINLLFLNLISFSIFTCYYLFVPAIYGGLGLYYLYLCFIKKEYKWKETFQGIMITLVIPFIIGMFYYILPSFILTGTNASGEALALEGYIYRDLFANFLLLTPAFISIILYKIKNKDLDNGCFISIMILLFMLFILILGIFYQKASSYYYFKFYYLLWLFVYIIIGKEILSKKGDYKMAAGYMIFQCLVVVALFFKVESKIAERNVLFNPSSFTHVIANIYQFNFSRLNKSYLLNNDSLELLNYIEQNNLYNENHEIRNFGDDMLKIWGYAIYNQYPVYNYQTFGEFWENYSIEDSIKNKEQTLLVPLSTDNELLDKLKQNYQIVYNNSAGYIMQIKSNE